jgi:hypothetical protein
MSYDPIPAAGAGADLFDQPSLFYLTNQNLIEEWHSLQSNVAAALDEWYSTTLRDSLRTPATDLGLEVALAKGPGSWRHVVLHPPGATFLGGKPVIGVGLAWPAKSANPSANSVFSCVRRSSNQTGKNAAAAFLDAGGRESRARIQRSKGADSDKWPIWRWVRTETQWWTDLDVYRQMIVDDVMELTVAVIDPLRAASSVPIVGSADETD